MDVLDRVDLDVHAVNDVLWDEIVAIEPDGEEQVYDATVVGGHNFVANGIAVHNSIEQDADMVILLHREDMYEKESPRAGEADFIVAKHRNGPTDTITVAFQGTTRGSSTWRPESFPPHADHPAPVVLRRSTRRGGPPRPARGPEPTRRRGRSAPRRAR